MSRSRSFVGLAAAVLLVGAASLAQAQTNSNSWNTAGPADWTTANWTGFTMTGFPSQSMGGNVVNNNGTVTIGTGDTVSATTHGSVIIGGSGVGNGLSGNGYVTMTGGKLTHASGRNWVWEALGVNSGSGVFTQSGGINVPLRSSTQWLRYPE